MRLWFWSSCYHFCGATILTWCYSRELQSLTWCYSRELQSLKRCYSRELQSLKRCYSRELQSLKWCYSRELQSFKRCYSRELQSLKRCYSRELQSLMITIVRLTILLYDHNSPPDYFSHPSISCLKIKGKVGRSKAGTPWNNWRGLVLMIQLFVWWQNNRG